MRVGTRQAAVFGAPLQHYQRVLATCPIAYWPLWEPSGAVVYGLVGGLNGTHVAVTPGALGIGDGRTSVLYDGATSYTNIHSAGLAGAFNGDEMSLLVWGLVSSGVWSDNTYRTLVRLLVNGTNWLSIYKYTNNRIYGTYLAGGTATELGITVSPAGFFCVGLTISKSNDAFKLYYNGVQQGTTQTGLGVWSGALTQCIIGADDTTPGNPWSGLIAHVMVSSNALPPATIEALARP